MLVYAYESVCVYVCKLICVLSRSSVETDNVVYLLSSSMYDEIRKSLFARVCEHAHTFVCVLKLACVHVCVCVCVRVEQ